MGQGGKVWANFVVAKKKIVLKKKKKKNNGHVISFITRHKGLGVSNKYSVYPTFLR